MYLSQLQLNPRCRQVRRDIASPYEMHRSLWRAFTEAEQTDSTKRILWRLEPQRRGSTHLTLLVQSPQAADWQALQAAHSEYLVEQPAQKAIDLQFSLGQRLNFRLRANPTVCRDGARHGLVREPDQRRWLERQAERCGFRLAGFQVIDEGQVRCQAQQAKRTLYWYSVRYEGQLEVVQPEIFSHHWQQGIGRAKAFGFGLLSLARSSSCVI